MKNMHGLRLTEAQRPAAVLVATIGLVATIFSPMSTYVAAAASHATQSPPSPAPPFAQCPAIQQAPSCGLLIVFNADGTATVLSDSSVGPYDGNDDTLVGVQNNTGLTVGGVEVTSPLGIFGFDGDGIGGTGPTGYEGPGTSFDIKTDTDGIVDFTGGLGPGKSTYFALEDAPDAAQIVIPTKLEVSSVTLDGSDVLRDVSDVGGSPPAPPAQQITDFPACNNAGDGVQWEDCSPGFPDGTPEKDWPVVYTRGSFMTVTQVRFAVQNHAKFLDNTTVTGTATLPSGDVLTFRGPATQQATGDDLVATNLRSDKPLPDTVAHVNDLDIDWTVKAGNVTFQAGTSNHPVYIVYSTPLTPLYESLVDITTAAANGQSKASDVTNATFAAFATKDLHRVDLDPATGVVNENAGSNAALLQYWTNWTFPGGVSGSYFGGFPHCDPYQTLGILEFLVGRCGGWAQLFADTLGIEGISASSRAVNDPSLGPGFPPLPPRPPNCTGGIYGGNGLMLIKNWTFTGPATGTGNYPYLTDIDTSTDTYGATREFDDAPGVAGQGAAVVPNPPGFFAYGDHAITILNDDSAATKTIYDPSYGTEFPSIGAWAQASLAGFACLTPPSTANGQTAVTVHGHLGVAPQAISTVTITPSTAAYGTPLTITDTVGAPAGNTGTPTGTVRFYLDGQTAPVVTLPLTAGVASFTTAGIGVGTHTIVATYDGDTQFAGSASAPAMATVTSSKALTGPINGSVVVPPGTTLFLHQATVAGSVVVNPGGAIDIEGSTIQGSFSATNATIVRLCGTSVDTVNVTRSSGFVLIGDPEDDGCSSSTIAGGLTLVNNTGGLEAIGNTVSGPVIDTGNSGPGPFPGETAPVISGNHR